MSFRNRDDPSDDPRNHGEEEPTPPPVESYFRLSDPSSSGRENQGGPWKVLRSIGFATLLLGVLGGLSLGLLIGRQGGAPRPVGPIYDEAAVIALFENAAPSIVELIVNRRDGTTDTGAGFFVDTEGHLITNNHVVAGADSIDVTLSDGRVLSARLLGASPSDDLALLSVDPELVSNIRPLKLADSDELRTGQLAIAIGSPFRMKNFLSVGVVAGIGDSPSLLRDRRVAPALQRPIPNMVWTDASLLPGNSGGPLLNADGEVIGVTSAVQISAQGDFGIGFAVPSNILAALIPRLMASELVSRPWLGIRGTSITPEISASLGITVDSGVYVREVLPNTGAAAARLRDDPFQIASGRGDVIVAINGRGVATVSEMVDYFNTLTPGDVVELTVIRDGTRRAVKVTLGGWPEPGN